MLTKKARFPFVPFIIHMAIPLVIGFIGSLFTMDSVNSWYVELKKPSLNPPNSIFGPVWSSLYLMIGLSAFLVWRQRSNIANYKRIVLLYFTQLLLNLGWSFIFFKQHLLGLAVIEILLLLVVIALNGVSFYKVNKIAGYLFIPYFLWVGFASYLTISIYALN